MTVSRTPNTIQNVTVGSTLSWDLEITNTPQGLNTGGASDQFAVRATDDNGNFLPISGANGVPQNLTDNHPCPRYYEYVHGYGGGYHGKR